MPQDPKNKPQHDDYYRPGIEVHPKKYSSSGGLADWGPIFGWFKDSLKQLWHHFKK